MHDFQCPTVSVFFPPQGLVSMNHILPREYLDVLVVLQDKALSHTPQEVAGERERERERQRE